VNDIYIAEGYVAHAVTPELKPDLECISPGHIPQRTMINRNVLYIHPFIGQAVGVILFGIKTLYYDAIVIIF